jgi:hypothetical protein
VSLVEPLTQPIVTSLYTAPSGVVLANQFAIVWNRTSSRNQLNQIEAVAQNRIGVDYTSFNVEIMPSYWVELVGLPQNEFSSAPYYLLVNGSLRDVTNSLVIVKGSLPISLTISKARFYFGQLQHSELQISLKTLLNGRFVYVYYLTDVSEYGNFSIVARHPFDNSQNISNNIVTWSILGKLILFYHNSYNSIFLEHNQN